MNPIKRVCALGLSLLLVCGSVSMAALAEGESSSTSQGSSTGTTSSATTPPTGQSIRVTISDIGKRGSYVRAVVEDEEGNAPVGLKLTLEVDGVEKDTATVQERLVEFTGYELQAGDTEIVIKSARQTVESAGKTYEAAKGSWTISHSPEELLGFTFSEYERTLDGETGAFEMRWNYYTSMSANGADIVALIAGDERFSVYSSSGTVTADLSELPHGSHTLTYVFELKNGQEVELKQSEPLIREGRVSTTLKVAVVNGKITATLTDQWGRPVANHPVSLMVGNASYAAQETNSRGVVTFNIAAPADGTEVICTAEERTTQDNVTYLASTGRLESGGEGTDSTTSVTTSTTTTREVLTTTSRRKTTTTSKEGETTTTAKTYPTVTGAGTTGKEGDQIAVNVTFDTGVRDQFGVKDADFEGKARLLLDPSLYSQIVGDSNAVVMLSVRHSPIEVTDQMISTAIANVSKYSAFHAENIQRITVDLSVLFKSGDNEVQMTALPTGNYTIRLPLPKSMQKVKRIGISAAGEEGISTPVEARIENGYLEFDTQFLSTFAILGFEEATTRAISQVPTLVIWMFVVAGVLLIGAGLLLYFFVIRKPAPDEGPNPPMDGAAGSGGPGLPPDQPPYRPNSFVSPEPPKTESSAPLTVDDIMEDLYSSDSRRPQASQPRPSSAQEGGVSLGSFQNRSASAETKKTAQDIDIDWN